MLVNNWLFFLYGDYYIPDCINNAYNYGNPGDEETGKKGTLLLRETLQYNSWLTRPIPELTRTVETIFWRHKGKYKYNPEVFDDVFDMRYGRKVPSEDKNYGGIKHSRHGLR